MEIEELTYKGSAEAGNFYMKSTVNFGLQLLGKTVDDRHKSYSLSL